MKLVSAFDSIEYESIGPLRKYRKLLKKINSKQDYYRDLSLDELKMKAESFDGNFDIKNMKDIVELYACAREVSFRLLGKFQYDVQILGALASLERRIIQMSTGSGKTITLILPAIAYGLTHKGCNVLTVNEYLSERDFNETKVVYEFFNLTCACTSNDKPPIEQKHAYDCDITYSTNSSLGFAYLNSCMASGINQDIKIINRPLYSAIIDEADQILMDDAINPLIIAGESEVDDVLLEVEVCGKKYKTQYIIDKLKTLRYLKYDEKEDDEFIITDRTINEIQEIFGWDDRMFESPEVQHIIFNGITAIFKNKKYEDYNVTPEADPDTGSRVVLIDKATGRLAQGRTLNDNLHSFVEMKEGVFSGKSTTSNIQITYQVLFNLFETITGVTGTVGRCFKEFYDIYNCDCVKIPDRLPNKLKEYTKLYSNNDDLYNALVREVKWYQMARYPILIGCENDNGARMFSDILKENGIGHDKLLSTDTNEEYIIGKAGEVNSIVVTTDIMGRGTDIKVHETDYGRGLVVFQIGNRPNSRVERQFAGRAARQGEPGIYYRLLSLPNLRNVGLSKDDIDKILDYERKHIKYINAHYGDILMNGGAPYYDEIVDIINEKLYGDESSASQNRIQNYKATSTIDMVQMSWIYEMDKLRDVLKQSMNDEITKEEFVEYIVDNSYEVMELGYDYDELYNKVMELDLRVIQESVYEHTRFVVGLNLKDLRNVAEDTHKTVNYAGMAKLEVKSEEYMKRLIFDYLKEHEYKVNYSIKTSLDIPIE